MIDLRKMEEGDVPAGLALCRSAGWNQLAQDWKLFLQESPDGCLVAIDESGNVAGTVTTIRYGGHFSWIGMVLVDPSKKRQGIGTRLLLGALKILDDEQTVKLDATPAGREVYLKLNFVDEYLLGRMHHHAVAANLLPRSNARSTEEKDLPAIMNIDAAVFGAQRNDVLKWIGKSAPDLAFVLEENNKVVGYSFGRKGQNYTQIGPVIAENSEQAIQLVSAAFQQCNGSPVIMDVRHDSPFQQWLFSMGFTEQRQLIRMYRGSNVWQGIPDKQFAILGPEFG